jgi:hypothetical protein
MAAALTTYPSPSTYWSVLFETLSVVFNRSDASDLVTKLKREMQNASPDEQLLFFHDEPFNVAIVVTGTPASPTLISSYLSLIKQLNWGP